MDLLGQLAATGLDSPWTILGAVAAFVVAGAAAGASGFGVVLVAAPLLAIIAPGTLPGAVMPLSFATNLTIVAAEGRHADGRAVRRFLAAGVVGVPAGAALTVAVGTERVGLVIAVVVAAATVAVWLAPPLPPGRRYDLAAGFVGGVSGGSTGVTGPPVALRMAGGDPPRVRATLAVFFCLVNVVTSTVWIVTGLLTVPMALAGTVLAPAAMLGVWLGRRTHRWLTAGRLRIILLVACLLAAVRAL